MRETKTISLPCGYKAEIITYWSWGERQELAKEFLKDVRIELNEAKPEIPSIPAVSGIDVQKKTIQFAVKKCLNPKGEEIKVEELFELPADDIDFLLAEINKIESEVKKK